MKYKVGDRIRFKDSKNIDETYKILEYDEKEELKSIVEDLGDRW